MQHVLQFEIDSSAYGGYTRTINTAALPNFFSTKKGEHYLSERFLKELSKISRAVKSSKN